jgi:hypothetical protein
MTEVHPEYVTRDELRDLVQVLDHRFGRMERWLWVLSTATVLMLMVLIYIASKLP